MKLHFVRSNRGLQNFLAIPIMNPLAGFIIKLIKHLLRTYLMKCFDEGIMTLFPCTFNILI